MLDVYSVYQALERIKDALAARYQQMETDSDSARPLLSRLADSSRQEILQRLTGNSLPGAWPSEERTAGSSIIKPFPVSWRNRADALEWAETILQNTQVCAVDGSQIPPARDYSFAVGAIQIGTYINDHTIPGAYVKTALFEVLEANDLDWDDTTLDESADQHVSLKRFERECDAICDYVRHASGRTPLPLCFFDGSFILSFAGLLHPDLRNAYRTAVTRLLRVSEECRVPVIGFVDSSYARDLVHLLQTLYLQELPATVTDAALAAPDMHWGDRTELFCCARRDRLSQMDQSSGGSYYHQVSFTYLKTSSRHPPARVEMPGWVVDAGLTDRVLDIVRAECIVGSGYPYPIETADALAVITLQERQRFYEILAHYLQELRIPLRYARKAASKKQRR